MFKIDEIVRSINTGLAVRVKEIDAGNTFTGEVVMVPYLLDDVYFKGEVVKNLEIKKFKKLCSEEGGRNV